MIETVKEKRVRSTTRNHGMSLSMKKKRTMSSIVRYDLDFHNDTGKSKPHQRIKTIYIQTCTYNPFGLYKSPTRKEKKQGFV